MFLAIFFGGVVAITVWLVKANPELLLGLLFTLAVARRAVLKERMLREELPGYADYMAQVKYRLIPYVW